MGVPQFLTGDNRLWCCCGGGSAAVIEYWRKAAVQYCHCTAGPFLGRYVWDLGACLGALVQQSSMNGNEQVYAAFLAAAMIWIFNFLAVLYICWLYGRMRQYNLFGR